MTAPETKTISPEEWMASFLPLGTLDANETWRPLGAGVLLLDSPVVWLVTAKSVLAAAGERPIVAWVGLTEGGSTLVDMTTGRTGSDLDWLRDEQFDLAAALFPVDPSWGIKAFSEARCFPSAELQPLLPVCSISMPFGIGPLPDAPQPHVFTGNVTAIDAANGFLYSSAPLLPRNAGAPLFVPLPPQSGGGVALAGIALQTAPVPEALSSTAPPVRLTVSHPISGALRLIRSEAGKARRQAALAAST